MASSGALPEAKTALCYPTGEPWSFSRPARTFRLSGPEKALTLSFGSSQHADSISYQAFHGAFHLTSSFWLVVSSSGKAHWGHLTIGFLDSEGEPCAWEDWLKRHSEVQDEGFHVLKRDQEVTACKLKIRFASKGRPHTSDAMLLDTSSSSDADRAVSTARRARECRTCNMGWSKIETF